MLKSWLTRADNVPMKSNYEGRLDYIDGTSRIKSTSLLFVGSVLGFSGFAFAAFLGFWDQMYQAPHRNFRGEPLHSYYPATVSEMVYNTQSAAGKCFFAFVLIGGICMLMSWYPWALRNVYVGDDVILFGGWLGVDYNNRPRGLTVLMLRQFLPPIGIMMVACIPAPPAANREFTDTISSIVHTLGATMSIGGYAFIELYTITMAPNVKFDTPINGNRHPIPERAVRGVLIGCCLFSIFAFQLFGFLAKNAGKFGICCDDVWQVPEPSDWERLGGSHEIGLQIEDEIANAHGTKLLLRSASGMFLVFKLGEYWFEVLSGLFMLASHLAIWWYCPERYVDLNEDLPDPDGADGHYQSIK